MSVQELREQRAAIAKALNALVEKPEWNAEKDQPEYDRMMGEIDALDAKMRRHNDAMERIAAETRHAHVVEAAERSARNGNDKGMAIYAKWLKGGDNALNQDDWQHVRNTMSTTTGSEGGFTVDSEVANFVVNALKEFGGMREVSTVIATSGVGGMSFPTSDGTSETGEIIAENQSATDEDIAFNTVGLPVYKFSSKVVTVPIELLQDSNVDIEAFVNQRLVERIGRITNNKYTVGSGTGEPRGVVTGAAVGVTAANGTSQVSAVTFDSLVAMQHSVNRAYRRSGACRWMFNDNTLTKIRQMKDGESRPIFVPGYETTNPGGMPDRLLGDPITINDDMANMGVSARSILYGDFSGYYIRDVMAVTMFRFTDSAFTKKGQVGFLGWHRSGGNLIDAGKIRAFVNAAS